MYKGIQFRLVFFFNPDNLSLEKSRVVKSPVITELGVNLVFNSRSTLFMKLGVPEFGTIYV